MLYVKNRTRSIFFDLLSGSCIISSADFSLLFNPSIELNHLRNCFFFFFFLLDILLVFLNLPVVLSFYLLFLHVFISPFISLGILNMFHSL